MNGRSGLLIFALAMAAAHAAWSLSRLVDLDGSSLHFGLALVPPVLWILGVYARSLVVLLVFVPLAWAAPAYLPDEPAFSSVSGAAAVWTLVVYAAMALGWSSPESGARATSVQWTPSKGAHPGSTAGAAARDAWLVAALVVGPAIGFLLTPDLEALLTRSFGPLGGLAGAGLCVLGTLLGLALATDVWRARPPRTPSRRRAVRHLLALGAAGLMAVFAR